GIGIDNPNKIRAFRDQHRIGFPLLVAGFGGQELARALGNHVAAMPYTAVIDRSGRVIYRKLGRVRAEELERWLDEAA
ncbi:MAG: TlpA family protein disulfide reductase, partial [Betaproteobacteria bacterium]